MNDSGNFMHSPTAQPIPPFMQKTQLLSGFQVSQALYAVAELEVATILMARPRTITRWRRSPRRPPPARQISTRSACARPALR